MSDFYSRRIYSGGSILEPPTRDDALGINGGLIHFQGLVVQTSQFGPLPLFESCIAWLNNNDRQSVWNGKKAVNDTHALVHLPFGPPLYDEPNQPYNRNNFPALDWTNGGTGLDSRFDDLIQQLLQNFNKFFLFLGGDGPDNQPIAMNHLDLLYKFKPFRDEYYKYCIVLPGYDSVFYGWEPTTKITDWGKKFRNYWPTGHLGLEHDEGHIPLGEGGDDYKPGGRLQDFDIILSEYAQNLHQDSCWQINGRLTEGYIRPPDQPGGDDPRPPYYLSVPNPRGKWGHCPFEYGEYEFVRGGCSDQSVQIVENNRNYQRSMNCKFLG
jgi:hypothetical protein